jgi:hypothetical protein
MSGVNLTFVVDLDSEIDSEVLPVASERKEGVEGDGEDNIDTETVGGSESLQDCLCYIKKRIACSCRSSRLYRWPIFDLVIAIAVIGLYKGKKTTCSAGICVIFINRFASCATLG